MPGVVFFSCVFFQLSSLSHAFQRDMGGAYVLKTKDNPDFQIVAIASYSRHGNETVMPLLFSPNTM